MSQLNLFLNKNLNGSPRIADGLNTIGRMAYNKGINNEFLFSKALNKFMIGEKVSLKLDALVLLANDNGTKIEVIQKSSKGQDFRNFIKADQKVTRAQAIENVAVVVRVGDIENSIVPVNSIVFNISFVRRLEVNKATGEKEFSISESLTGIDLVQLPDNLYKHQSVLNFDSINIKTSFKPEETFLSTRPMSELSRLAKVFDMYSRSSTIKLREHAHFISKFYEFLKQKQRENLTPYFVEEEAETDETVLKENKHYKLLTFVGEERVLEPKDKLYIISKEDSADKVAIRISNVKEINYEDEVDEVNEATLNIIKRQNTFIEEQTQIKKTKLEISSENDIALEEANRELSASLDLNKQIKADVDSSAKVLEDAQVEFKLTSKKIKKFETQVVEGERGLVKVSKQTAALEKAISVAEKDLKELKDNRIDEPKEITKKSKAEKTTKKIEADRKAVIRKIKTVEDNLIKYHASIKENDGKLIGLKQSIIFGNDELKVLAKELKVMKTVVEKAKKDHNDDMLAFNNLQFSLDKEQETVSKFEGVKKLLANELDLIDRKIEKANFTITSNKQKHEKLVDLFETFQEDNTKLVELSFSVVEAQKEKTTKKSISVVNVPMGEVVFQQEQSFILSDYDAGLTRKYERFNYTMRAYESGSYKSPYAALSLEKPDVELLAKDVRQTGNIKLNTGQKQALKASVNSHFASFLQGPPGTGKTQVISSAVEYEISQGRNVLISSSTNAAINNAMDRLNRQKNNPNVFFLRQSNNIEKLKEAADFSSKKLYSNFMVRLDNHVLNESGEESIDTFKVRELLKEPNAQNFIPEFFYERFVSQITQENSEGLEFLKDKFNVDEDNVEYAKDDIESDLSSSKVKRIRKAFPDFEKFIAENDKTTPFTIEDTIDSYIQKVEAKNKTVSNNAFAKKLGLLKDRFLSEPEDTKKVDEFEKLLFENSLINVIGITTTSHLVVGLSGTRDGRRELFVDYPINFAVIDEISKSVTPEILSISKLADRFMFAGDYRQLPPAADLSPKLLEEFRLYAKRTLRDTPVARTLLTLGLEDEEKFRLSIEGLMSKSLFTNQVRKLKQNPAGTNSYTALRTQYRFNEVINKLVNTTYDDDEQLKVGKKDHAFNKYDLGIKKISNARVNLIDTSEISEDFAAAVDATGKFKETLVAGSESFDQNIDIFSKGKFSYNSKINNYNAFVVVRVVENLRIKNKNKFDPKNVGIIAMTRSQAMLIKNELRKYKGTEDIANFIKVDTVDNFQGQERDIIILDLVRAKGEFVGKGIIFKNRNLNFYKKPERINVAISRAQSKMIIVGALENYLQNEVVSELHINGRVDNVKLFKKWFEIIDENGGVKSWMKY